MTYQVPRLGKPPELDRWISTNAGFSLGLISALKPFQKTKVSDNAKNIIIKGISDSRIWVFDLDVQTNDPVDVVKTLTAVYTVAEVCRQYGHTCISVNSSGIASMKDLDHPWMDNDSYQIASIRCDLLVIEGAFPDRHKEYEDYAVMEYIMSQRVKKRKRPTIILTPQYEELPTVKERQNYDLLKKLAEEKLAKEAD